MTTEPVVLVVEDDADVAEMLQMVLERSGLTVQTAQHGLEALEWLQRGTTPRVILLDLMMPVMDGWAFLAEMRERPAWANIPVLVLSGAASATWPSPDQVAGLFRKPIDLHELLPAVHRYTDGSPTADAALD